MTDPQNQASRWSAVPVLITFAILATLAISMVDQNTREAADANRKEHAMRLISEVLAADNFDNEPSLDIVLLEDARLDPEGDAQPVYRARRGGEVVAVAMTAITDGYVGPIKLLIGVDQNRNIVRVRAAEQRETPGLGDKIEPANSDWITLFDGANLQSSWRLRRDGGELDHISGATITSRAVVRQVRVALEVYAENKALLLTEPPSGSE